MHKREKIIFSIAVIFLILWVVLIVFNIPSESSFVREIVFLLILTTLITMFVITLIKRLNHYIESISSLEKALIVGNLFPMITTQNGEIIYTNRQFLKLTGYRDPFFVIGGNIKDFFGEETYKKIQDFLSINDERRWIFLDGYIKHKEDTFSSISLIIQKINVDGKTFEHFNIIEKDFVKLATGEKFVIIETILNNLKDIIIYLDIDNNIKWVNQMGEKYFGERATKITGEKCHKLIFNNDSICNPCIGKKSIDIGSAFESEIKLSDGRYYLITAQPIITEKGDYTGCLHIMRDITQQKETEIKRREIEAKLNIISEQLPTLIWSIDEDLRVTYINGVVLKHISISKDSLLGKTLYEIFRTSDPENPVIKNALLALTGVSGSYQIKILNKYYMVYYEPYRNLDDRIVGCIGVSQDITELINIQKELEEKNNILLIISDIRKIISYSKSIDEMIRDTITIIKNRAKLKNVIYIERDNSTDTIFVKEAVERDDLLYKTFNVRFDIDKNYQNPLLLCYLDRESKLINDIENSELEEELKDNLKKLGYKSILLIPIIIEDRIYSIFCFASEDKDDFKNVNYLKNIIDDIRFAIINIQLEKRHRKSEEIIKKNQIMMVKAQKYEYASRFATLLAHDFNNILFSINSYLQLIIKDIKTDNKLQEYVNQINLAVKKGGAITSYLMKYSSYDSIEKSNNIFSNIYNTISKELNELCKLKSVKLISENHLNNERLLCSVQHITEAILLCSRYLINRSENNSTLFFQSTPLFLSNTREGNELNDVKMVKIEIMTDSLFSGELLTDDVFEITILSKEEKQPEFNLPLVGNIIRLHGGYIYAEKGANKSGFIIVLPLLEEAESRIEPNFGVIEEEKNILLVEDDPFVKEPIEIMLKELKCNIFSAPDGSEALKLSKKLNYKIDILITDIEIPTIDGITLAEELYKHNNKTKIIYISGYIQDFPSKEKRFIPNSFFFQKPFPLEQLKKIVVDAIKSS